MLFGPILKKCLTTDDCREDEPTFREKLNALQGVTDDPDVFRLKNVYMSMARKARKAQIRVVTYPQVFSGYVAWGEMCRRDWFTTYFVTKEEALWADRMGLELNAAIVNELALARAEIAAEEGDESCQPWTSDQQVDLGEYAGYDALTFRTTLDGPLETWVVQSIYTGDGKDARFRFCMVEGGQVNFKNCWDTPSTDTDISRRLTDDETSWPQVSYERDPVTGYAATQLERSGLKSVTQTLVKKNFPRTVFYRLCPVDSTGTIIFSGCYWLTSDIKDLFDNAATPF